MSHFRHPVCIKKTRFYVFYSCLFSYVLETCKIKQVCLIHISLLLLSSFIALFSCSLSYTEFLFCIF